ncbi:hypothetical protein [Prauserella endophytica]|uniref:Uncharacterized protein n=1 Tax=Prauserella endophytica TaxID=1592324 RepID=A0ABY2S1N6_9PSEU|nr:hypothetical protein [Prauserella endophytica]PXY20325.1 hypothetical protein BAY59_31285 [Prauserella coralliicola]TKG66926.1 hypothetical protein FCN18_23730 [Prauserella endophytica]
MELHENLRVEPGGARIAQRIPAAVVEKADEERQQYTWLAWSWPGGLLMVDMLTDADVADWLPAHTETAG